MNQWIATSRIIASYNFSSRNDEIYHPSFYAEFTKQLNIRPTAWSGQTDADTTQIRGKRSTHCNLKSACLIKEDKQYQLFFFFFLIKPLRTPLAFSFTLSSLLSTLSFLRPSFSAANVASESFCA